VKRPRWDLLVSVAVATLVLAGCQDATAGEVTITAHYSHFGPGLVRVPAAKPVTFVLRNEDPIEHEWIIGPPEAHERHRTGTEPVHDSRPDEVTVPALSERTTTLTFDKPGDYVFICHLPGHEAYGMRGVVRVVS
jgi:uncharacterized cupredoxin-like copper-binding protein